MGTSVSLPTRAGVRRQTGLAGLAVPAGTPPMEARLVDGLPDEPGLAVRAEMGRLSLPGLPGRRRGRPPGQVGQAAGALFPGGGRVVCGSCRSERFVLDGELAIPVGEALCPSTPCRCACIRPRAASASSPRETPAMLILFDMLVDAEGRKPARRAAARPQRRAALSASFADAGRPSDLRLSPFTRKVEGGAAVARRAPAAPRRRHRQAARRPLRQPGERAMLKVKRLRTADCVVGGFRYGTDSRARRLAAARPLRRRRAGSTMSASPRRIADAGARGADADASRRSSSRRASPATRPGGPSRWSTERSAEWQPLRPELVVEVRYDHVTGDRFRHGTKLLRWRPDKAPRQCTFEQMGREARPSKLIAG